MTTNPPTVTVPGTGNQVTFDFGDITNSATDNSARTFDFSYQAVVVNVSSNQDGTKLTNSAVIEWNSLDEKGNSVTKNVGPVSAANVTVISPELQVTKTAVDTTNGNSAPPITGDAGDTITYTIVVEHAPSSDTDAFDLALTDVVPAGMTYITNSASLVSGDAFTSLSFDGGTQTLTIGWVLFPAWPFRNDFVPGHDQFIGKSWPSPDQYGQPSMDKSFR